ncbi:hypothetical protein CONLIGDRAFT_681346 [Coniochaeta ligniaria NRRL 30616]|uniref:Uncharacterized protein n=1 Tax=Coniochaeta ligniaria NRRL 30616 TaxID=1408157 RepID=A0A1J7JL28_9PEZI|nr:hypothetical protein CONLIGDRAFT_681346 [Coniochaeta ligniaria NRRL 30616]
MKCSNLSFLALCLGTKLVAAQCNVDKYCAYTYNTNNCAITKWNCDGCDVPVFYECNFDSSCNPGATSVNNLCCHADQLANGAADCPTTADLQACGGFTRTVGSGSEAAWVPPYTDIPEELKCEC